MDLVAGADSTARRIDANDYGLDFLIVAHNVVEAFKLRRRIPIGVLSVIYEARPNVTIDIATLSLKTGNAVILRGGSETLRSNLALVRFIQTSPVAPYCRTNEMRSSSSFREYDSPSGVFIPFIFPPSSIIFRKTWNGVVWKLLLTSWSSSPNRVSGRSVPNRFITSS